MSRKTFIESQGATCKNWNWSWSFINEAKRFIIFGAWDRFTDGRKAMIFSDDWKLNSKGQKNKGYGQSREHIRLIEEEGYQLMTFPMEPDEASWQDGEIPTIKRFTPVLSKKTLMRAGTECFAADLDATVPLAEELTAPERFPEGARCSVTINAYERNPKARAAGIAHHGYLCAACGFDFAPIYGTLGKDYIHVHHVKPIGKIGKQYEVDPKNDLIPVCPNCHSMIHRTEPPLTVEQLRTHLREMKQTTVSENTGK
jgi:5-methylcytosine-specific restriction protein A